MTTTVQQECINTASDTIVQMSFAGALGYLCARVFGIINPVHGAAFCAVSAVVTKVVNPVFDKYFNNSESNHSSKLIGILLSTVVGTAVSASLATLAGFSISFNTAVVLLCSTIAVGLIATLGLTLANTACN